MSLDPHHLAEQIHQLGEIERRVMASLMQRQPVSRDPRKLVASLTLGQRVADRVAAFGGSWTFIFAFVSTMILWIGTNEFGIWKFDPRPFILLNLVLSCLAALQAPVIMMSQNRQADKDRQNAQLDYEVNLKAEMEVMSLHTKLDHQMEALMKLQAQQLDALERIESALRKGDKIEL